MGAIEQYHGVLCARAGMCYEGKKPTSRDDKRCRLQQSGAQSFAQPRCDETGLGRRANETRAGRARGRWDTW